LLHFCHFSSEFKQDQAGVDVAKVGVDVAMVGIFPYFSNKFYCQEKAIRPATHVTNTSRLFYIETVVLSRDNFLINTK